MSEYTIYKDVDYSSGDIEFTVTGGGLTDASITYALVKRTECFTDDLDDLATDGELVLTTAGGGVVIVDDETFRLVITDSDTAAIRPGTYWALVRVVKADGTIMRLARHEVTIGV